MNSQFNHSFIIVRWDTVYNKFVVIQPIRIELNNEVFDIPKNFRTDFGSIPALFRILFNPIGKEVPAYLLHDYLCSQSNKGLYNRKLADKKFEECLVHLHTSIYRRKLLYIGVRAISIYKGLKQKCFPNF